MNKVPENQGELTKEEIEKRRDDIAKRMLTTPPQPHKSKPKGKTKPKKKPPAE